MDPRQPPRPRAVLSREERALGAVPHRDPHGKPLLLLRNGRRHAKPLAHAREESLTDPDQEWVWNDALSAPLRALGIPGACPPLLQGLAESRRLADARGIEWRLAVFGRRSSSHPGTRYLARGLNAHAAPGNEVEMEQLVWRKGGADVDVTEVGTTEAGATEEGLN